MPSVGLDQKADNSLCTHLFREVMFGRQRVLGLPIISFACIAFKHRPVRFPLSALTASDLSLVPAFPSAGPKAEVRRACPPHACSGLLKAFPQKRMCHCAEQEFHRQHVCMLATKSEPSVASAIPHW